MAKQVIEFLEADRSQYLTALDFGESTCKTLSYVFQTLAKSFFRTCADGVLKNRSLFLFLFQRLLCATGIFWVFTTIDFPHTWFAAHMYPFNGR